MMVKGISRQVIVVHSPDPKLFEQAIFILKDGAVSQGITEDVLIREAKQAIHQPSSRFFMPLYGAFWAALGALVTSSVWALTNLL
ncbi:MAG: hypothetical protein IJB11_05780 [Oscillospiraceae bacterium]|nr:hypothetical protein [Oscillospiraceae bacterium]